MGEKSICKFYIESSELILWLSQKTYKEAREWIEDLPAEYVKLIYYLNYIMLPLILANDNQN
jgi:hypothetical protein